MKFNLNDKIKCIDTQGTKYLTNGKVYTVLPIAVYDENDRVKVLGDDGDTRLFFLHRFEAYVPPTTIEELIELGKTLLNKECLGGPYLTKFTPNQLVIVADSHIATTYSSEVVDDFHARGWSVALRDTNKRITYPVLQTKVDEFVAVTIKLTRDYDATVYQDRVQVGCQAIPHEKIDELYNLIHAKK